jgi:hypothetical protein
MLDMTCHVCDVTEVVDCGGNASKVAVSSFGHGTYCL